MTGQPPGLPFQFPPMPFAYCFLAWCLLLATRSHGAAPVDFNREVRPILSEKCYHCHGPDDESRKAKLRLDVRDDALKERDGVRAIVPGRPDDSELMIRVRSKDPDEMMPPPKEHHTMSAAECDTLARWITEGANYAQHWAFVKPTKPAVPAGAANAIDGFISAELKKRGLALSPEADRHVLLRRLSLDLTGLPPTPEETRAFVEDTAPDAHSRAIDRLLASPHFGERWARMWLDLARYADSSGYGSDFFRLNIWPWRDWVIKAFNSNVPFDRFTREQLAGDLLPNPTREQLVATAFHRNTMTNFEGGTPDEEYRVAAVKDRVATTMQVWMGLTAGCAQCHSHKFDPISMREYYQLFAVFNQSEDADRNDEEPKMPLPTSEQEKRMSDIKARIVQAERQLQAVSPELEREFTAWLLEPERKIDWHPLDLAPGESGTLTAKTSLRNITALRLGVSPPARDFVLRDVKLSARPVEPKTSRARYVRIEHQPNKLIQVAELEVFSGTQNIARGKRARQSSTYADAVAARAVDGNTEGAYDKGSVAHTGDKDPNPLWELDLGTPASIDRIVFWNRTEAADRIMGAKLVVLDEKRQVLLSRIFDAAPKPSMQFDALGAIDAAFAAASADFANAGQEPEKAIDSDTKSGWSFAPEPGKPRTAVFELKAPLDVGGDALLSVRLAGTSLQQLEASVTTAAPPVRETPASIRQLLALPNRTAAQHATLLAYFRPLSEHDAALRKALANAKTQLAAIKPLEFPIMRELPAGKQRETRVLNKGNYLMPGDVVLAGVPAAFNPPASNATVDRLALAEWLLSRDNPLTARVAVNRFWAQLFGTGIVESEEDFGTQGNLPSHPELLDWLAVTFSTSKAEGGLGWDMKALLKLIVSSATYRQSSKVTPELLAKDPRDQLLSRYPRRRLAAEEIRDQALAASGLLSPKLGGASVYPPQPDGLWNVAFNGGQNKYPASIGDNRYRRGLYTFWRRTMPNPTMVAFDAPSRETCTIRRVPTNTPLQAFVMLNDPVFVECAQGLARRILRDGGDDMEARLRFGLELVLARPADAKQIATLRKLLDAELAKYQQDTAAAVTLATQPIGPLPSGVQPFEAAAWTAVANVLLNLDAFLTRS